MLMDAGWLRLLALYFSSFLTQGSFTAVLARKETFAPFCRDESANLPSRQTHMTDTKRRCDLPPRTIGQLRVEMAMRAKADEVMRLKQAHAKADGTSQKGYGNRMQRPSNTAQVGLNKEKI